MATPPPPTTLSQGTSDREKVESKPVAKAKRKNSDYMKGEKKRASSLINS